MNNAQTKFKILKCQNLRKYIFWCIIIVNAEEIKRKEEKSECEKVLYYHIVLHFYVLLSYVFLQCFEFTFRHATRKITSPPIYKSKTVTGFLVLIPFRLNFFQLFKTINLFWHCTAVQVIAWNKLEALSGECNAIH